MATGADTRTQTPRAIRT